MTEGLKIVVFDLETIWNPDAIMREERYFGMSNWPGRTIKADLNSIITFGYQVLGETPASVSVWDFADYHQSFLNDDFQVCAFAWNLLHDADYVVTHNGKSFDWKVLQTRLKANGLPLLPNIPHGDTKQLAKSNFSLYSNSLKDVAEFLGVAPKISTSGRKLWNRVYAGDKEAMKEMAEYCEQDVGTTGECFMEMLPFVKNLPNQNIVNGTHHDCPTCGSSNIQKNGFRRTKTAVQQRYRCSDCGSSSYTTAEDKPLRSV